MANKTKKKKSTLLVFEKIIKETCVKGDSDEYITEKVII